jgi:hypothetical protein
MGVISGDDRRRLVPLALVSVINTLLSELEDAPDFQRVELRSIRDRLCLLYRIPLEANATQVAQDLAEEDGECVEDSP